ncbi:hypothetical protein CMI37_34200 [Candidatus Pacearchaeota archaeon]|nr:hypothetical protein [Candidatus Pacearchaeota archaeon]|tara:strand:+ start:254 stop:610 length:357 start_codon:yes stop_codon:yes gene_type:complete
MIARAKVSTEVNYPDYGLEPIELNNLLNPKSAKFAILFTDGVISGFFSVVDAGPKGGMASLLALLEDRGVDAAFALSSGLGLMCSQKQLELFEKQGLDLNNFKVKGEFVAKPSEGGQL